MENFSEETDNVSKPKKQANVMWSKEEDDLLTTAVSIHGNKWDTIYSEYHQFAEQNRSKKAVCGHWKHLLKKTKLSDGRKAKDEKAKEKEDKIEDEQNIIEVESELEEESFTIEVPKVKTKRNSWTEEQINLLKKAVAKEGTVWSQIMIKYPQFEKWRRTRKGIAAYWENMQKKDAKAEIKKEIKNNIDESDEKFVELMKLSKEKLEELVKSYGKSIYVEGAGSLMFKPELVTVLLSDDVNFDIKDLHEELDEDENEDNYKTNVKFWNKINSENLGKQYYHRNFSEFCWTPKDNRHKITILSGHDRNGYITISLHDKDDKRSNKNFHRFIYQAYHPEPTKCLGEDCIYKELDIFDIFSTSDQVDHIDGDSNNNDPENLQRLCLPCHAKKTSRQTELSRSENISKSNSVPIIVYKKDDPNYKQLFNSITDASNQLKISRSCIQNNIDKFEIDEIAWIRNKGYRFEKHQELLEGEIFKDIPDFYDNRSLSVNIKNPQVSNKGRIKTIYGRITEGQIRDNIDYFRFYIYNKSYPVSVLVLKTWDYDGLIAKATEIKNSEKYPECKNMSVEDIIDSNNKRYSIICDHIDRNKKNNNLENLRWLTYQENSENVDKVNIVQQFTKDGEFINEFPSLAEAGRQTGIGYDGISKVCRGKRELSGGFYWRFKPDLNEIIEI